MRKNIKLPTILGVIVLVVGMVAGIYLINTRQVFKLSANVEAVPRNVRFSNITDSSVTVTWTTDIESNGFVKWGTSSTSLGKVALEENSNKSFVHSVNVLGIPENTDAFFRINSESKDYDNNGVNWQAKTASAKINQNNSLIATGTILQQDGKTPSKSIVYLSVNGKILSGITSAEGTFIIPISAYIDKVADTTAIELTANAGPSGTASAIIYPKAIKSTPLIMIGKTYDFRSITVNESADSPESTLSVPESVAISSRFEIENLPQVQSGSTGTPVTVDSIDEGEIINTTDPEFFGKGPKNTDIQISIHSELQEAALTTDSKGTWKWSPPTNLEPGSHTMTVSWRDASGVLRTITRNFVVQASEGPAFVATPSATPIDLTPTTPIASSSPSASPKATKTPVTTAPPTPETGDITPTLGLLVMGIGILLSSIFLWRKSNVY